MVKNGRLIDDHSHQQNYSHLTEMTYHLTPNTSFSFKPNEFKIIKLKNNYKITIHKDGLNRICYIDFKDSFSLIWKAFTEYESF